MNPSVTGIAALLAFCFIAIRNEAVSVDADARLEPQPAFDLLQSHWRREFAERGDEYIAARLTPYRKHVESACGGLLSPGHYYCASDRTVYFDLALDETLRLQLSHRADRLRMYVLAHELVHHVQALRGMTLASPQRELHADCLAGFALRLTGVIDNLELGDIEGAMQILHAEDARSHGAAANRLAALHRGQQSKSSSGCEKFASR